MTAINQQFEKTTECTLMQLPTWFAKCSLTVSALLWVNNHKYGEVVWLLIHFVHWIVLHFYCLILVLHNFVSPISSCYNRSNLSRALYILRLSASLYSEANWVDKYWGENWRSVWDVPWIIFLTHCYLRVMMSFQGNIN